MLLAPPAHHSARMIPDAMRGRGRPSYGRSTLIPSWGRPVRRLCQRAKELSDDVFDPVDARAYVWGCLGAAGGSCHGATAARAFVFAWNLAAGCRFATTGLANCTALLISPAGIKTDNGCRLYLPRRSWLTRCPCVVRTA